MAADLPRIRFVCLLSIPRTGSTHLCELLKSCPALNIKGELFHKTVIQLIDEDETEALRSAAEGAISDDTTLLDWRANHPVETLETLYAAGHSRIVFFKLFPGHLTPENIKSALFERDDIRFLILKRRPIESFISNVKAKTLSAFSHENTTSLKPALDPARFIGWAKRQRRWYQFLESLLAESGIPYAGITYENDVARTPDRETVSGIMEKLHVLGLPQLHTKGELSALPRQDREPKLNRRVANWNDFRTAVAEDPQGRKLLRWAMTVPGAGLSK